MSEMKDKKAVDVLKEIASARKALREFRFGIAGSKIKNMREARNLRRAAARGLTELSQRRIANGRNTGRRA